MILKNVGGRRAISNVIYVAQKRKNLARKGVLIKI
jgi:hypothetical protein